MPELEKPSKDVALLFEAIVYSLTDNELVLLDTELDENLYFRETLLQWIEKHHPEKYQRLAKTQGFRAPKRD